jgi:uncharacterized protein (TIGR00369 family)
MGKDDKLGQSPVADVDLGKTVFGADGKFTAEFVALQRRYFQVETPFNQHLGLTLYAFEPDVVTARLPMRPELVGHRPTHRLHGGAISAAMDVTGGFSIMAAMAARHPDDTLAHLLPRFNRISTITLHVDYLKVGISEHFFVSSRVLRLGARVASTRMDLLDSEGRLLASGSGAYMVS